MSALPQVNAADPAASPLLVKALTAHGGATEPPFKTRNHPAFPALETWVRFARAAEGTSAPQGPPPGREAVEPKKLPNLPGDPPAPPPVEVPGDAFGHDSTTIPKPTKPAADDPFDPAIFNGEVRPKK
jgi:hypothetical protein